MPDMEFTIKVRLRPDPTLPEPDEDEIREQLENYNWTDHKVTSVEVQSAE